MDINNPSFMLFFNNGGEDNKTAPPSVEKARAGLEYLITRALLSNNKVRGIKFVSE